MYKKAPDNRAFLYKPGVDWFRQGFCSHGSHPWTRTTLKLRLNINANDNLAYAA